MLEEILKIDLTFNSSHSNSGGTHITYHTNLMITFKNSRRMLLLSETTHKSSFWPIIESCHKHNDLHHEKINCAMIIPKTEHELITILSGWQYQHKDVLKEIETIFTKEYAIDNNLSFNDAKNILSLLKIKVIFGFIFFVIVFTIILVLFNGVTFRINIS